VSRNEKGTIASLPEVSVCLEMKKGPSPLSQKFGRCVKPVNSDKENGVMGLTVKKMLHKAYFIFQ
jgi:hypothetical protein